MKEKSLDLATLYFKKMLLCLILSKTGQIMRFIKYSVWFLVLER
jgi:hypothetical protein